MCLEKKDGELDLATSTSLEQMEKTTDNEQTAEFDVTGTALNEI